MKIYSVCGAGNPAADDNLKLLLCGDGNAGGV